MSADSIRPTEEEAVGDWLAFRYSNPHVQRWEDLPVEYVSRWLREARDLLTYVDQFRKVRAAEVARRSQVTFDGPAPHTADECDGDCPSHVDWG